MPLLLATTPGQRRVGLVGALALMLVLTSCSGNPSNTDAGEQTPIPTITVTETVPQPTEDPDGEEVAPAPTSSPSPAPTTPQVTPTPTVSPMPTVSPTPSPTPEATGTPAPPAASGPAAALIAQACKSNRLTLTLTASVNNGYRKGITKVFAERQNEYNAWVGENGTWLGAYAGSGDQWTVQPPGSRVLRYKDNLRITVTADDGTSTVLEATVTAPC